MFCRKCGLDIGDANFCPSCGAEQVGEGAPQQSYQQPAKAEMSVGDWLIVLILVCIPIVGLVCLLVWAIGSSNEKPSRKNWAIANLVLAAIIFLLIVIFALVLAFV